MDIERELFEEIFNSRLSGAERECDCGRIYFDTYNDYDGEWETELAEYEKKSNDDPDKYIGVDYTVGTSAINGKEFVLGCLCNSIVNYKKLIDNEAPRIIKYLKARADNLREKANDVDPEKAGLKVVDQ